MFHAIILIFLVTTLFVTTIQTSSSVSVYDPVPGLDPSPYYKFRIRDGTDEESDWMEPFAFLTECTLEKYCNYFNLENWTNTYINFEMSENTLVEIEITKLFEIEQAIVKASVHPSAAAVSCKLRKVGVLLL